MAPAPRYWQPIFMLAVSLYSSFACPCPCRLDSHELSRLGVHQLRRFLEALLQQKYLECIPAIVPLLDREHRTAEQRLAASRKELEQLATDKLKVR